MNAFVKPETKQHFDKPCNDEVIGVQTMMPGNSGETVDVLGTEFPRNLSALEVLNLFALVMYHNATDGAEVVLKAHGIMEDQFYRGSLHGKKIGYDQGYKAGLRDAKATMQGDSV